MKNGYGIKRHPQKGILGQHRVIQSELMTKFSIA